MEGPSLRLFADGTLELERLGSAGSRSLDLSTGWSAEHQGLTLGFRI